MTDIPKEDVQAVRKSGLFDEKWYLEQYPDVKTLGMDPIEHYLWLGASLERKPSARVDRSGADGYTSVASQTEDPIVRRRREFDRPLEAEFLRSQAQIYANAASRYDSTLVSIVMPAYNRADTIDAAISSVLRQSHKNWLLFIVDDGSTDGTIDRLKSYRADPRIVICERDHVGVSAARNAGLELAKGELVAYLDSDNIWLPEYLRVMVTKIVADELDCAYAAAQLVSDEGSTIGYLGDRFDWDECFRENYIDLNTFVHRRELYERHGGFDLTLRRMVDWDVILRYTRSARTTYCPFVACEYASHSKKIARITNSEPMYYRYKVMEKYVVNWSEINKTVKSRQEDLISIIIPNYNKETLTLECVNSIIKEKYEFPVEVVIVDNSDKRSVILAMLAASSTERVKIKYLVSPANLMFSLSNNYGVSNSSGSILVFLNNDTVVETGWLHPMVRRLQSDINVGAIGPRLIYPNGTLQSGGIVFGPKTKMPYPIYQGFDAENPVVNLERTYAAVTGACIVMRATEFAELHGFDTAYINGFEDVALCMSITHKLGKSILYMPTSTVIHFEGRSEGRGTFIPENRMVFLKCWGEVAATDDASYYQKDGYEVLSYEKPGRESDGDLATYVPLIRKKSSVNLKGSVGARLLFAIKAPVPSRRVAEEWGDYHFGIALGAAIERLGYSVRMDLLPDWETKEPADVNIVLRGLSKYVPKGGETNILWHISHPDKVHESELEAYDVVFVASISYAEMLKKRVSTVVRPLLQCTDGDRFGEEASLEEIHLADPPVLFVGNSRNVFRPIVRDAIAAGIPPKVYGTRWEQFIGADMIVGDYLPNERLPKAYRSAGVLLNDHWGDMGRDGFLSNRLFDAAAAAACIVSDRAAGIEDVFGKSVAIYNGKRDLRETVTTLLADPARRQQMALAARDLVLEHHTFDHRAKEIVEAALEARSRRVGLQSHSRTSDSIPTTPSCNVCGGSDFGDMGNRLGVRCTKCGSLERTRALLLFLQSRKLIWPGARVLHLSPEQTGLSSRLELLAGDGYETLVIDGAGLRSANSSHVNPVDSFADLPSEEYDLILHSHVMQRVTADLAPVFFHLHRSLSKDGAQIFSLPITSGRYDEYFGPLTREDRVKRFGAPDSVRRFGREDIARTIGMVFRLPQHYDLSDYVGEVDLARFNVPESERRGYTGSTIFYMKKTDIRLRY